MTITALSKRLEDSTPFFNRLVLLLVSWAFAALAVLIIRLEGVTIIIDPRLAQYGFVAGAVLVVLLDEYKHNPTLYPGPTLAEALFYVLVSLGGFVFIGQAVAIWLGLAMQVFMEELFFRGWLFARLGDTAGSVAGAVASTGLFIALHALNPGFGLSYALFAAFFGLAMCYFTHKTGNIWLAVGLHFLWNLIAL